MRGLVACCMLLACTAGVLSTPGAARGADPENCLGCHRYRGLGRIADDGKSVCLYQVNPDYYDRGLGPHARLRCTQCHPREEVGVIPHRPVSPVNCTTACHLAPRAGMEVRFSHDNISEMLGKSVHTAKALDTTNNLLGAPLREGQARCLLCHDEPMFRRAEEAWRETPSERCDVCHGQQIPIPMSPQFMFWHVFARSRPARSHAGVVRLCAVCHSNEKVRSEFGLPDTTASYLASFHGKAMQLGSEETAGCLDCHVGKLQNVHMMQAHADPSSPTNEAHLADTCRSPACHPTAGHRVSTAAVHLNLGTTRGVEFFIGVLFVLLIIFTFGPSLVIQLLELLQIVVGRHVPDHHQKLELAERLMADPRGRQLLRRFTPHQRVQHWVLMISFTTLVLTGFPIKFADRAWAQWLTHLMGGLTATRMIHRYAGVLLLAGFAYHVGYILHFAWRQTRAGKGLIRTLMDLPMATSPKDLKDYAHLVAYLLFLSKTRPESGRFSLREKFEYIGVFWGSILLGITGVLMWANAWTTSLLPGRVLTVALLIHTFEAFLALLHVGIVHMVGVIFSPVVFPLSPAMFNGQTPAEELAEAHSGLLNDVARKVGLPPAGEVSRG
jgi:formate dehydrogenase gamma subunit